MNSPNIKAMKLRIKIINKLIRLLTEERKYLKEMIENIPVEGQVNILDLEGK